MEGGQRHITSHTFNSTLFIQAIVAALRSLLFHDCQRLENATLCLGRPIPIHRIAQPLVITDVR
jgi:hypothetical protein